MTFQHIKASTVIRAAGAPPKDIEEFVGRVNTGTSAASVARMKSPPGWGEPGQTPDFDEYTLVLAGSLRIETRNGRFDVATGEAFVSPKGAWVRYSSPGASGADYISVCFPAFAPDLVHRDE